MARFWWLYGTLFMRHYMWWCKRASGHWPMNRLRRWCWSHKTKALAKCPIRWVVFRLFFNFGEMQCQSCGFAAFDMYAAPWFECRQAGTSVPPGEPTTHWFYGVQTCPRCRYSWEVSDSD